MELIAFGALLAADMGQPFSSLVLERLKAGARFLVDLQDENGNIPAIGDDDEGRALLAPHIDEPRYAASVAACVLGLCGEAREGRGLAPGYFRERLFGVAPHRPNFPAATLQTYREGGYTILRRRIVGRDIHLVFDHGPLGYLSLAAHGHADALAVWLSVDGRPVFIDAGTWLYHSGEDVRNELRSSQAHNTLSLAQMSQSEPSAAFSWAAKAQAHYSDEPADANASWRMAGEHDGYRARAGLAHRREIAGSPHGFAISDMLRGEGGAQAVELSFLCAPDILAYEEKGAIVLRRNGRAVLRMIAPEGFTASIAEGRYSPRFGELGCTAKILLAGRMAREPARTVFEFGTGSA